MILFTGFMEGVKPLPYGKNLTFEYRLIPLRFGTIRLL